MQNELKEKIENTYAEAFEGVFSRLIITAANEKLLKKAAFSSTALPLTVFGESEAGIERFLSEEETPDKRKGAVIQIWVAKTKDYKTKLGWELGKRIRQGTLVVPTTRVFAMPFNKSRAESIDAEYYIGRCGDGYEFFEERFGRKVVNVPIMMGEFLIEQNLPCELGVMGGNLWYFCDSIESALRITEKALEEIKKVQGIITPFDACSAGSKVETKYPDIGPTTNHYYCPTLRNKIPDSKVPANVASIPEIVINGADIEKAKEAMKKGIESVINENGLIKVSAGNYGGKLGKYKIYLNELIKK